EGDRLAHPVFDHADGDADERLRARAAAHAVHVEVEADAEVAGEGRTRGRVVAGVREHAVDVRGLHARVGDGVAQRPGPERACGQPRAARVGRLAHSDDRVFVAQVARGRSVGIGR